MSSYTYSDIVGCLVAAAGFALVLGGPGYVVGWMTDMLSFRRRGLLERIAWSVPLSFGVSTVTAIVLTKYGSLMLACCVLMGTGLVATGMIAVEVFRGPRIRMYRRGWGLLTAGILLTGFVICELVDIGLGNKLYMSVTVYDHALRTAFVDSVVRTGVPPGNPLYWIKDETGAGHAPAMRYYYFWYVVCALVVKTLGVSGRQVMIASCAWAGGGTIAVIALYCRHFILAGGYEGEIAGSPRTKRRLWITLALLAVTGLDIAPVIAEYFQGLPVNPDMEWWSQGQVTSWIGTMLWVPHHLAALVCCVFGFLLIWLSVDQSRTQKMMCALLAGLAFAASLGLSTYVAAAFAMTLIAWMLWACRSADGRRRCVVLLGAGLVAVVLLLPYLRELRGAGPNTAGSGSVFTFAARRILDPWVLAGFPGLRRMAEVKAEGEAAALVLIIPGYMTELGFFGAALVLALVRWRKLEGEGERTAVFLAVSGLVVSSFVKSTVIGTNDFGIRSMLVSQFFLLLLGGLVMDGALRPTRRWARVVLYVLLVAGVVGSVYQGALLRIYLPVQDALGRQGLGGLGERTMALRELRAGLEAGSAKNAVVQYDTRQPAAYFNFAQMLNTPRQIANAMPECVVAFGGDPKPCPEMKAKLGRIFSVDEVGAEEARKVCAGLGIDELIATKWDPVWKAKMGWVWGLPTISSTSKARVLDCRTNTR